MANTSQKGGYWRGEKENLCNINETIAHAGDAASEAVAAMGLTFCNDKNIEESRERWGGERVVRTDDPQKLQYEPVKFDDTTIDKINDMMRKMEAGANAYSFSGSNFAEQDEIINDLQGRISIHDGKINAINDNIQKIARVCELLENQIVILARKIDSK